MNESEQISYTVHEASRVLGTTESAVRAMVVRKQLPTVHVGGRIYILREALQELLRGRLFADPLPPRK